MSGCACVTDPLASACGVWDGNESLCVCADLGLVIESSQPAPS